MTKLGKYGNRRTTVGLEKFDSKAESLDWIDLRLREKAGQISQLRRQVTFTLLPAFVDREGTKHTAITWRADFTYEEGGRMVVFETKGRPDHVYPLKEKLFRAKYPDVKLIVHYVDRRRTR